MKLIPIRAVVDRLGLSYGQIECDPILKVVRKNNRDYVLSASVTAYKRHEMRLWCDLERLSLATRDAAPRLS
jgi:hypothetical protein